jgi:hypothetical protein
MALPQTVQIWIGGNGVTKDFDKRDRRECIAVLNGLEGIEICKKRTAKKQA